MKATFMFDAGDVRVVETPDPVIQEPTDAIIRTVAACVCGSDLHPYRSLPPTTNGRPMGHEMVGIVTDVGAEVRTVRPGDFVIAPFAWSCGECDFCHAGLQTSCRLSGSLNRRATGLQAEIVRAPRADGSLVPVDVTSDTPLLPGLLSLSDVYCTGFHAATTGGVRPGHTVAVIGDGAVGLLAVLSAAQLGAERIILMGRHESRTSLGRDFGATDVVSERGDDGIAAVHELTNGDGAHVVLEAVGHLPAFEQALGIVRPGGAISRVGVPQYSTGPLGAEQFRANVTITGGVAPVRAYIERLLPGVLDGTVDPGRVFDRELPLADIAEGYRLMDDREALKVLIRP